MKAYASDWEQIHFDSTLIDLHSHPSLKISLFYRTLTSHLIVRTIDHLVNVAGVEHVGIGTDSDGFTDPPDNLKDYYELPNFTQRLLAAGYHKEDIHKILGENAMNVFMDGWKR